MIEQLENIKTYLLAKYTSFDEGYANVSKPNQTDIIIDSDLQKYAGITDNNGNYFYIRSLKKTNYKPIGRGSNVAYYEAATQCRIVVVHHKASEDDIKQILLNTIHAKRHHIDSIDTDSTRVFKEETGQNLEKKTYTIVSCDFTVTDAVSAKNCTLNPCNC
jgi:hypothetical protein